MVTKKKVDHLLSEGYSHLSVDKKDLSEIPVEKAVGDEWYLKGVVSEKKEKRYSAVLKPAFALAALVMIFAVITFYQNNFRSFATIYLDVNPSIEVSISKNEKVLSVTALNEDAERILDGMDFKGSSLKVTVNALIGSLVRNGYINELQNSILVSVADVDIENGRKLEEELLEEISSLIENGSVLSQQVYASDQVRALAEKYGISLGKAQLVIELADASGIYTYDELANLTVHELNLLNKNEEEVSAQRTGEPSEEAYIGTEKAIEAALRHANLSLSGVHNIEAEMEYEDGRMIYEVEFIYDGRKYEYEIDAKTAQIAEVSVEGEDEKISEETDVRDDDNSDDADDADDQDDDDDRDDDDNEDEDD